MVKIFERDKFSDKNKSLLHLCCLKVVFYIFILFFLFLVVGGLVLLKCTSLNVKCYGLKSFIINQGSVMPLEKSG